MAMALSGVAVASGAAVQRITGFGFSLVSVPFLVLLLGPVDGVRLVNVLACVVGLGVLARAHAHVRWPDVGRFLLPALVVGPVTGRLANRADPDVLSICIGLLTLTCIGLLATGVRARSLHGWGGAVAAGAISAAANTMAGVGGPSIAMFSVNAGWDHDEMRGTMAAYFLGLNAVSIASRGLPADPLPTLPVLASTALAGVVLGGLLGRRVTPERLRLLVLVVATGGSLSAIANGIL